MTSALLRRHELLTELGGSQRSWPDVYGFRQTHRT
jgi:hypothetical protein